MSIPESSTANFPQYKLNFLCCLISKTFDGNRSELFEFLSNCDNAFRFADESQVSALMAFIVSKITGSAKAQLRDKEISNWNELKSLLLQLYSDKKHYTQLMEELNTIKQNSNESVTSFYNRIDKLYTRILNSLTFKNPSEKIGRCETIREIALQRFILHSAPEISRFLRSKQLESLSDALNAAIEEERASQVSKLTHQPSKFCTYCKKNNHNNRDCYKRKQMSVNTVTQSGSNSTTPNINQNNGQKFCKYCKKKGHLINQCFLLNKPKSYQQVNSSNTNRNAQQINLNEHSLQKDVVSADWD